MRGTTVRMFAALVALAGLAATASAGSLGVSPIRVSLSASAPTAALTLDNGGTEAVVVQLQVLRWSADGEGERHEPSDDIIATPPIMTIHPGQPQIVRVGLSGPPDPEHERAYRLYMEEVPPPPQPGRQGLQVALRIGVPVFVAPTAAAEPTLEWHAVRTAPDALTIRATNSGRAHVRLVRMSLRAAGADHALAEQQVVGYLLPGQSRDWPVRLNEAFGAGRVRLSAETDRGATSVDLDLEGR